MSLRDLSFRAAVLDELHSRVGEAKATARGALALAMHVDAVKSVAVLAGESPIGTVSVVKGRTTARVHDPAALLEWAATHHPDQVVTRRALRPEFEARVLQQSKAAGQPCMDGVLDVPGVTVSMGEPYLRLVADDSAPEVIDRLWAEGAIDLRDLIALPGGEA